MAAAELELNIATSTISRHVKDLEGRLGLTLCRRGRGGFALSAEGEKVYAAAGQLLSATESFRSSLHEIHHGLGGELHVATFEKMATNPDARIGQAIARFRRMAPDVSLHFHVGTIAMIERGVLNGQFHLGIIPEHRRSESLRYDELFDESMRLYVAPGHSWFRERTRAFGWKDLREQPLAALGYHSPNMMLAHTRRLERAATASDQEAVAILILSGCFVGFLPDHYAESFVRSGQMRAIAPETLSYRCRFSCVYRRAPTLSRVAETFRTAVVEAHAANAAKA